MPRDVKKMKKECLKTMLGLYKKANAGHVGASLSCLDLMVYIFSSVLKKADKFILSKGHAAAALYTVLAKFGHIPEKLLETFYKDGTKLAAHPPCGGNLDAIPFGTGSLGHGLSLSSGIAFSNRFTGRKFRVFCVLSEGDCNEGSTWEAALFAGHHRLSNLVAVVDNNGIQSFGRVKDVMDLEPLAEKFRVFNFETVTVSDGHDFKKLDAGFRKLLAIKSQKPKCLIAKTVKGAGLAGMENTVESHYLPLTDAQYEKMLRSLEDGNA